MQISHEIKTSLQREYSLCSNATAYYKKAIKDLEKKHGLSTRVFLIKFAAGELGDDADFFEWYSFANLLSQWQKTQTSLRSAIR